MNMLNRKQFLGHLLAGLAGLGLLPRPARQEVRDTWLWEGPVAGFRYHAGPGLLADLAAGQALRLVPEPENPYDDHALALYAGTARLGYIPRADNRVMSRLAQGGHPLWVRITAVQPAAADWEKVWVRVGYGEDTQTR